MALTKVGSTLINATAVNAVDFLSDAGRAKREADTLTFEEARVAVQAAIDYIYNKGGGTVYVQENMWLRTEFYNLNFYGDSGVPILIVDQGRSDHLNHYFNTVDADLSVVGTEAAANSPIIRIHNAAKDGNRNPAIFFSKGTPVDASTSGDQTPLMWAIFGSLDGNAHNNVPASDLVISGGHGSHYITGTVSVTSGSATVTGSGTAWTDDFVGAILTLNNQSNAAGIVKSVESNTSLTLESTWDTYGGVTEASGNYLLRGGYWNGTLTQDYKSRLTLGQNYTWLFNPAHYVTSGRDFDPLDVANGNGDLSENISYIFHPNRKRDNSINVDTLLKLENPSSLGGSVGHIYRAGGYAGDPMKTVFLDKASDELIFSYAVNPSLWIAKVSDDTFYAARLAYRIGDGANASATQVPAVGSGIVTYNITTNTTFSAPTATLAEGQEITYVLTQDGGSNTVTWNSVFKLAGGSFTMTATDGKIDTITFIVTDASTPVLVEKCRAQNC